MSTHDAQGFYGAGTTSPELLTVNEVGRVLKISRWTVYRLVREGDLRGVKVGERLRFRIADIDRYLERDREPT